MVHAMKSAPVVLLASALAATLSCREPEVPDHGKPPHTPAAAGLVFEPVEGRLSTKVRPVDYQLSFVIDPEKPDFTGRALVRVRVDEPTKAFTLHARDMKQISAALVDHADNAVTLTKGEGDVLRVEFRAALEPGEHVVAFDYAASFTSDLAGLYRVESGGVHYAYTQFEALDARRAFPCFDEPSFKARYGVTVRTPKSNHVIANTREVTNTVEGAERVVTFAPTELLPTYLVALAVGPFDIVDSVIPSTKLRKDPLPFRGVAVKGKGSQLAFAMEASGPLLTTLEEYFGIAYPFDKLDILAVPDFGAGAMENAGAVTFREQLLLLDPNTASESQRRAIVDVAAHEYAHQWFGNLVTMAYWDDLWLNEAFATWLGEKTVRSLHRDWETDLEFQAWSQSAMDADSLVTARVIRQPIKSDGDVESAFDALTYSKGGALIAMYERFVGEEKFRDGIRGYMKKYRFSNATTDQFLEAALAGEKPAVIDSFKQFLDAPGVPSVAAKATCTDGKLRAFDFEVSRYLPLGSSGDPKQAFKLPLCINSSSGRFCGVLDSAAGARSIKPTADGLTCPTFFLPNDGGEFYVRATPSGADVKALLGVLPSLSPRERLAVVDAVRSGFRKGTLSAADAESALLVLAKDPIDAVRFGGVDVLGFLDERVVPDASMGAFRKKVQAAYAPVWNSVGWQAKAKAAAWSKSKASPPDKAVKSNEKDSLTRAQAFYALAMIGRDAKLRKEAVAHAKAVLEHPSLSISGFDPELLEGVLTVGVVDGGLFDLAVKALPKTQDAMLRRSLLLALGSAPGKEAAQKRVDFFFSGELRQNETFRFLLSWFADEDAARLSWDALKGRLPEIVQKVPEGARDRLPMMSDRLCDASREAELKGAFEPLLATIPGGALALSNALERNRICAAIVNHHTTAKP